METQWPEAMVRDVHPAEVLLPDGTLIVGCRAFVTTRRFVAFGPTPRSGIEVVADFPVRQPVSTVASLNTLNTTERLEIATEDGGTIYVNKGRGCGCHSPLKALDTPAPWSPR